MRIFVATLLFMNVLYLNFAFAEGDFVYDTVKIGGINQVVAYKGAKDGPLILFLHGGPGSSRMPQAEIFTTELQKKCLVVQWDQRETGKTLQLNKTTSAINLDMMVEDTHALIEYLLRKFKQKKIYLVGESWGTVLGFEMAQKYPKLIQAYLAISPVVDQVESEKRALAQLINSAKKDENPMALRQLATVKIPFENYSQIYYLRKWLFSYDGQPFADSDTTVVKEYLKAWSTVWLSAWNEAMLRNLTVQLPKVNCPVYFFLGGKDYQTNCEIAKAYYEQLSAPKKNIYWFDNSGHSLLITDAAKVQNIILTEIIK